MIRFFFLSEKIGRGTPTTASFPEPHDKIDLFHLGPQGIFQKAAPLYDSGRSLREISRELGISKATLRLTLLEGGADLRPLIRRRGPVSVKTAQAHVGVPPYGYCIIHGRLVEVPKEQQTIQLVMKLWSQGKSLTAIASHLNRHKIKPRTAKSWDHSNVRSVVNRNQSNPSKET